MVVAHEQFEEAVPLYAVGALDRPERQALDVHLLTGCAPCHAALRQFQTVVGLLPYGLPAASPPAGLKTKILTATQEDQAQSEAKKFAEILVQQASQGARLNWRAWIGWMFHPAIILLLILLLAGGTGYAVFLHLRVDQDSSHRQRLEIALQEKGTEVAALKRQVVEQEESLHRLRSEVYSHVGSASELKDTLIHREVELDQLREQFAQQEKDMAALRKSLAQRDEWASFFRSPAVRVVLLSGHERARAAGALILLDPDSRKALLYAYDLPPLPGGKIYQLWAVADRPVSVGMFTVDAGRKARLVVRALPVPSRITLFTVTLEPEGGRSQPTGDVYLSGQP